MGNSYTRQSAASIITGAIVQAAPLNDEFNALQSAFDGSSGHSHDGTTGEGQKISLLSSITGVLPVLNGGTGGINNTTATTSPTVSNDSTQGYAVGSVWVNITGGVVYFAVDVTPGAASWKRNQTYFAGLQSIGNLTTAADQMIYTTGSNVYATTALTPLARTLNATTTAATHLTALGVSAFAQTILDDIDAATMRATLALGSLATQNSTAISVSGGTLTGVTVATPTITNPTITGGSFTGMTDIAVADGGTGASTAVAARANLGLQDMSTQAPGAVAITGGTISGVTMTTTTINSGTITGITDLAVADGGTGASNAAGARLNLGLDQVDNTSDANKPVSTATTTQLNLKAPLASPALTGTPTAPTASAGTNTTQLATTAFVTAAVTASGAPDVVIEHQTASGTNAGAAVAATWNVRTLNTKVRDPSTLVTLASNQFTPSVNMWCEFSAPATAVDGHQTRIFNVTDANVTGYGTTGFSNSTNAGIDTSRSFGGVALVAGKTYRLDHYTTTAYVNGLGAASSSGGTQSYARLVLWRM